MVPGKEWYATPKPYATCKACKRELRPQQIRSLHVLRSELAGARMAYAQVAERLREAESRISALSKAQAELESALVGR